MSTIAAMQLEFLGQTLWWAGVVGVTGLALLLYAGLLLREGMRESGAGFSAGSGVEERVRVFGMPLMGAAVVAGLASLALTPLVFLLGETRGSLLAAGWTFLILMVGTYLFYKRVFRHMPRFRRWMLLGLRGGAMGLVVMLLFQPLLAFVKAPDTRQKLSIVVDASESMSIGDQPNEPNRYRQSVLAVRGTLVPRLSEHYDLQVFVYDGKHGSALKSGEELEAISPNGKTTDLPVAVGLGTSSGAAQTILFSDGIHNGPAAVAAGMSATGGGVVPVHTVRVGSSVTEPATVPDIAVVGVEGPQTATVNNGVVLTASIKSTAMSDRTVRVILRGVKGQGSGASNGGSDEVLDEQRVVLRSGPTPQTVQLKFTPEKVGRMVVKVSVPVDPGERSDANNMQEYPLLVTDSKLAVLYVEGRVRPEVGPLRRTLEQDPNISAISMVQTQAGKFELRGVKEGDDLKGLPTTLAQWKRFKVIILGDLDATFLNGQQLKDVEQAVREGAGLLMIGGQNSFASGGWGKTVLATALPVGLEKVEPAQINAKFVPQLTATGAVHPIFRNIATYFIGTDGSKAALLLPDLSGCVALGKARAGATVLAVHPTAKVNGEAAIVLAVQQYGKGRSAAFAADTTWNWNLSLRGMGKDSPYNRFWGQMVRWLASQEDLQKKSGPSVTAMIPKERYEAGEAVMLRAAVTDKDGQSTAYAGVWADVEMPNGKTVKVPLAAVAEQVGMYEATYRPQFAGVFKVMFHAGKEGLDLGKDGSGFSVLQAAGEGAVLAAQPATLHEISTMTGGSYVELSGVGALADRLVASVPTGAVAEKRTVRLFHFRGFFLVVVVMLGAEIFLRRKWQLQ